MACNATFGKAARLRIASILASALLSLAALASARLIVANSSNGNDDIYSIAREFFDGSEPFSQDLSGDLLDMTALASSQSQSIVLVHDKDNLVANMRSAILRAQQAGALAVVMRMPPGDVVPGRLMFQTRRGTTSDIKIPCFSILYGDYEKLLVTTGASATITVEDNRNAWYESAHSVGIIVWYVFVAAVDGATVIFAIARLGQYIYAKGCVRSIAIVALGLNIFGLLIGTIYWSVDPQSIRQVWPRQLNTIALTFALPFIFSADLLVVLYWLELLTHKNITAVTYLKRLRIPFYAFVGYLIVAEIITSIIRVFVVGAWPSLISILNVIVALIVVAVTVFVVIHRIRKSQKDGFVVNDRLKLMNRHMIAMAVLSLIAIFALIMYIFLQYNPVASHISIGIVSIFVCSVTTNQINMFMRPARGGSSIQTKTASHTKTRNSVVGATTESVKTQHSSSDYTTDNTGTDT